MKKKLLVALLLVVMLLFAACQGEGEGFLDSLNDTVNTAIGQYITGEVSGQVGKTYATQWFTFTVHSIEKVDSYAGYTATEGNVLYDVLISETNTFSEDIPMGTFDYVMDEDSWADYAYALDPLDDTMMPAEIYLAPGESLECHLVFEVPDIQSGLKFIYHEINELQEMGTVFTIQVN